MRRVLALTAPWVASLAFSAEPSADCYTTAQTQQALSQCAGSKLKDKTAEMLALLRTIQEAHSKDRAFLDRLSASQAAWTKYRDAQLAMLFPHSDEPSYYGSVQPMCEGSYLAELADQRIATLRRWVEGTVEGDVCAGSMERRAP